MFAGVAPDNPVVSVRAFIDMEALLGRATGSNVPCRATAAIIEPLRRIHGRKMLLKDSLDNPRFHHWKLPALTRPYIREVAPRLSARRTRLPS